MIQISRGCAYHSNRSGVALHLAATILASKQKKNISLQTNFKTRINSTPRWRLQRANWIVKRGLCELSDLNEVTGYKLLNNTSY